MKRQVKFDIKPVDDILYGLFEGDHLLCLSPKKTLLKGHLAIMRQELRGQ